MVKHSESNFSVLSHTSSNLISPFHVTFQGILVSKDFDILKEAGMSSFGAVQKQYKAHVSENYLEIHLFWTGKGTCCIPVRGTYGPAIAAISATPGNIMWKFQMQCSIFMF